MSMASISVLTFGERPNDVTKSIIGLFPMGKLNLPRDSRLGDVVFESKKKGFSMQFLHQGDKRRLLCYMENFDKSKRTFRCDLTLMETVGKSMVIATPWEKPRHFYYNQKINNLRAGGYAKIGEETYDFNKDSFGVLDWGRGVWTYSNTWYWASASWQLDGIPFGFNLGYGFGDTSAASENALFYDWKIHKLNGITFNIPQKEGRDDYMSPWTFTSDDGRFFADFVPVIDRASDTNVLLIESDQHQVFGRYTGRAVLDDGTVLEFSELPGFAEKVRNRW
jgi:hypothetical protein